MPAPVRDSVVTYGLSRSRKSLSRSKWNWSRRSWIVCDIDVPTLPPSLRNRLTSAIADPRKCFGTYMYAATLIGAKISPRPRGQHHPRPDHLPRTHQDVQIRHPIVRHRQHDQPRSDQPPRIDAAPNKKPTITSMVIDEMPPGDSTSPA